MKKEKYNVTGMTCAACQANVTRCVQKLEGVEDVNVSLLANQMTVDYDETKLDSGAIVHAVEGIGYGASPADAVPDEKGGGFRSEWETRPEQSPGGAPQHEGAADIIPHPAGSSDVRGHGPHDRTSRAGILTGMENAMISALTQLILTVPILVLNRKFYKVGLKALIKRAPNMDSLWPSAQGLP